MNPAKSSALQTEGAARMQREGEFSACMKRFVYYARHGKKARSKKAVS